MSLHSRIFVPGVSRNPSASLMGVGGMAGASKGFVPPTNTLQQRGSLHGGGPSSSLMGGMNRGPAAASHQMAAPGAAAAADGTSPIRGVGGTVDAAHSGGMPSSSSSCGLSPSSALKLGGGLSSLPQPPPLAGRPTATNSAVASIAATPTMGSAALSSSLSHTNNSAGAHAMLSTTATALHDAAPSRACSSHVVYCPCCGRRGRFVHDGDDGGAETLGHPAATLSSSSASALPPPPPPPPAVDLTKRPPTAFKLYCDAIEPSLVAQKMNAKDRRASMTASYDALGEAERQPFEAKAAQLAKELKALKKRAMLSGGKTGRDGGDGGGDTSSVLPRRTKSSFMLFCDDKRPSVMEQLRGGLADGAKLNIADVGRTIGELWKALSEEERKVYTDRAEALKTAAAGGNGSASGGAEEGEEGPSAAVDDDDVASTVGDSAAVDASVITVNDEDGADDAADDDVKDSTAAVDTAAPSSEANAGEADDDDDE